MSYCKILTIFFLKFTVLFPYRYQVNGTGSLMFVDVLYLIFNIQAWGRFDVGPARESKALIDQVNAKYAADYMEKDVSGSDLARGTATAKETSSNKESRFAENIAEVREFEAERGSISSNSNSNAAGTS